MGRKVRFEKDMETCKDNPRSLSRDLIDRRSKKNIHSLSSYANYRTDAAEKGRRVQKSGLQQAPIVKTNQSLRNL